MALVSTDPVVFARDANNNLEIPLRKASGLEGALILIRSVLLLWRGEWFLDQDAGMPYLETEDGAVTERDAILGQVFDPAKTARAVRREILTVSSVLSVPTVECAYVGTTRTLSVMFVARTVFGDTERTTIALAA